MFVTVMVSYELKCLPLESRVDRIPTWPRLPKEWCWEGEPRNYKRTLEGVPSV